MTNSIESEEVTPSGAIFDSTAQTNDDDCRGSRPSWNRQLDFIFSLIGYAVGVGNIWRFPYLCYRNGGGAFLIPYSLMLFACGIPLFFLEVSLGQFSNKGAIKVWDICPLFRGVGIGTLVITTICNVYYNLIVAFILFYLFSSFTSTLPWSQCNHEWNSPSCIVLKDQVHRNETMIGDLRSRSTSTFEFWHYKVLNVSEGLHHMGTMNWKLAGYFILAWIIAYLCLIKGIKSTGKVWNEAATQIFYSLGPGWSGLITMASYNRFHNNCLKDSCIVSLVNCGTSVYAGLLVFSILGFMSHVLDLPLEQVATEGLGLAFIVYPEALLYLPVSSLWSILFFLMLFTVGIDTIFVSLEVLFSAIFDQLPEKYRDKQMYWNLITSILLMLLGFPFLLKGGIYLFQLFDWYVGILSIMTFCLIETCVVCWIYGSQRFVDDIQCMLEENLKGALIWKILWSAVNPIILCTMIVSNMLYHVPIYYGNYVYPQWSIRMGWAISCISLIPIPIYAICYLYFCLPGETFIKRLKMSLRPSEEWDSIRSAKAKTFIRFELLPKEGCHLSAKIGNPYRGINKSLYTFILQ